MTSANVLRVRMRRDLAAMETHHARESAIVVKDPVAMKYHRLRPDEWFVLRRLDATRSLANLCREYEGEFAPQKVSQAEMNHLLFRFHQSGLTISDAMEQGDELSRKKAKDWQQKLWQQLSSLLFIRFPGIDPHPFLRWFYPIVRPGFHLVSIFLGCLLLFSAVILFLTRWDIYAAEFPTIDAWLRMESLILLGLVIGGTKILHELGHAVVCKHFGGECHQIGPMLLVFTPALYCDTSDAWMMPLRRQRIAVGAAGIATEMILASIATWVWAFTAPGIVHSLAMNVMLVCGVSTVLFNANPLLRYDGYYILSDWVDVPNLADRSKRFLNRWLNQWLLGVSEPVEETMTLFGRLGLFIYAVAAAIYRWSLTLVILWFLTLMLRPVGLESMGYVLFVFAVCGMAYSMLKPIATFMKHPARRGKIKMKRFAMTCAFTAIVAVLMNWPLPATVASKGRIVPRKQSSLYVATPGVLTELRFEIGDLVSKDQPVAILSNRELQYEYLKTLGRTEKQRLLVAALRQSRFQSEQASSELPAAESLLEDLEEQLRSQQTKREALTIRASQSGILMPGARKPEFVKRADASEIEMVAWDGYPTDKENANCYLDTGTEILTLRESDQWDVEIVLSQTEVGRIEVGALVKLAAMSHADQVYSGRVAEISRSQWSSEVNASRWDDPTAANRQTPASTSYLVRVAIDDDPSSHGLIAGGQVISRIEASRLSVAGRIWRSLNSLLRFR